MRTFIKVEGRSGWVVGAKSVSEVSSIFLDPGFPTCHVSTESQADSVIQCLILAYNMGRRDKQDEITHCLKSG